MGIFFTYGHVTCPRLQGPIEVCTYYLHLYSPLDYFHFLFSLPFTTFLHPIRLTCHNLPKVLHPHTSRLPQSLSNYPPQKTSIHSLYIQGVVSSMTDWL